tara:strand:- start:324 stop:1193 length:870 start_codon:yes stop_codon:yes gene_type:complete
MNEELQDKAALYALGALEPIEASAFEEQMFGDPELSALVGDLCETTAAMASTVSRVEPSSEIRARIMASIQPSQTQKPLQSTPATQSTGWRGMVGWGIAAGLSACCVFLWNERSQLEMQVSVLSGNEADAMQLAEDRRLDSQRIGKELAQVRGVLQGVQADLSSANAEVAQWREKDAMAQMRIATLQSTVDEYQQGVAVVVWDSEKHEGMLKLERMPAIDPGKDYQLWVVDPKNPKPVNAGVVRVDEEGFANIQFKPVDAVSDAAKFALSVEREGGVPENEGPIVLIGP